MHVVEDDDCSPTAAEEKNTVNYHHYHSRNRCEIVDMSSRFLFYCEETRLPPSIHSIHATTTTASVTAVSQILDKITREEEKIINQN